jgi:hypothetical protein
MASREVFSLSRFLAANPDKNLSSIDYLHAVFKLYELPDDFLLCMARLFSPDFIIVDGLVFLSEKFELDTYKKCLDEGKSPSEIQLWLNLIEVTGLFEGIEVENALSLAHSIETMWNQKIRSHDDNEAKGVARVIYEKDDGEIFVTIDQC